MSSFKWPPASGGGGGESLYSNEWSGDLNMMAVDVSETIAGYAARYGSTVFLRIDGLGKSPNTAKASGPIAIYGFPVWAHPPVGTSKFFSVNGKTDGHIEGGGANCYEVELLNASGTMLLRINPMDVTFMRGEFASEENVRFDSFNLIFEGIEL